MRCPPIIPRLGSLPEPLLTRTGDPRGRTLPQPPAYTAFAALGVTDKKIEEWLENFDEMSTDEKLQLLLVLGQEGGVDRVLRVARATSSPNATHAIVVLSGVVLAAQLLAKKPVEEAGIVYTLADILKQATDCELEIVASSTLPAVQPVMTYVEAERKRRCNRKLLLGGLVVAGIGTGIWLWCRSRKSRYEA